jgi:peptidoglycan/LPS O-acetylase OafA/YrhL
MATMTPINPVHERESTPIRKIAELDGVRAVSIIFVLLVHISYGRLSGGFLGVDIFFVLSGYLITLLLLRERDTFGTINLKHFYVRRALRILPALLLACALALVLAPHSNVLATEKLRALSAVLLFYANFLPAEYLGDLAHTWSLAIEEQFYLVWPLALVLALRVSKFAAALLALIVIVAGIIVRIWIVVHVQDLNSVYTFTLARVDTIMVGCLLALLSSMNFSLSYVVIRNLFAHIAWATSVLLALALVFCTREFMQMTPFAFTLFAIVVALYVASCQKLAARSILKRVMLHPVSQWFGARSYGLYLYHYPIFGAIEAMRAPGDVQNFVWVACLKVAASLAFTELAWRLLEQPILRLKNRFPAGSKWPTMPVTHI